MSSAGAAEADRKRHRSGSCPAIEVVVRRWARLSVGRWDRCGDDKWSAVHWVMALFELPLSSGSLLLLSSCISPETERLRSLRVLQKQVARPQEAVGQRLRIILSREKAIESGWLGMAWEPRLGWAVRCLYEEKLIDFFSFPAINRVIYQQWIVRDVGLLQRELPRRWFLVGGAVVVFTIAFDLRSPSAAEGPSI